MNAVTSRRPMTVANVAPVVPKAEAASGKLTRDELFSLAEVFVQRVIPPAPSRGIKDLKIGARLPKDPALKKALLSELSRLAKLYGGSKNVEVASLTINGRPVYVVAADNRDGSQQFTAFSMKGKKLGNESHYEW